MKKNIKIFVISLLALILIVISFITYNIYMQNKEYKKEINSLKAEINDLKSNTIPVISNTDTNNNESRLIKLSLEELETMVQNKETFILVITQTTCGHCISYKPTLNEVLEETSQIAYEIDIQSLSKEDKERVYKIAKISGTPTTVFIFDGEEKDLSLRLAGSVSADTLKQRLKETGYIK